MAVGRKGEQSQSCFPYQNRVASIQLNNGYKCKDWGLGLIRVTATTQIHTQGCSVKAAEVIQQDSRLKMTLLLPKTRQGTENIVHMSQHAVLATDINPSLFYGLVIN